MMHPARWNAEWTQRFIFQCPCQHNISKTDFNTREQSPIEQSECFANKYTGRGVWIFFQFASSWMAFPFSWQSVKLIKISPKQRQMRTQWRLHQNREHFNLLHAQWKRTREMIFLLDSIEFHEAWKQSFMELKYPFRTIEHKRIRANELMSGTLSLFLCNS